MTALSRAGTGSLSLEELQDWNSRLYGDILPGAYGESYADPAYAARCLGGEYGQILSFLYAEMRAGIPCAAEGRAEYLVILFELFIEVYNCFEAEEEPQIRTLREIVYWYASDYCDVFAADRIREQIDPAERVCHGHRRGVRPCGSPVSLLFRGICERK